jgi:integrase/recombinase XerD
VTTKRLPKPFTPAELATLRQAARPDVRATLVFLEETGLRSAEARSITLVEALAWPQPPRWCLRRACARHSVPIRVIGKGSKERVVLLTPTALRAAAVMAQASRNGHLIGWSERGLRYVIAEVGHRTGIHAHPHRYRHTHVTQLIESGVPIEVVADMVGHSTTDITRIYWAASERLRAGALRRRGRFLGRTHSA